VYHLLNTYHDKLYKKDDVKEDKVEDEELDVEEQLKKDIEKSKKEVAEKAHLFNYIDTGVQNLIFIRTSIDNPQELGTAIIRDLYETKSKRTKVTLRFLPIQAVCKAKIEEIKDAGGLLFDKYFLKESSTFGIIFNKRFNNDVSRDEVIKELADLVHSKNAANKVNLKEPQLSIIVEIIKGFCLISVVPDFHKMKKYNLNELWERKTTEIKKDEEEVKE
jgi:tRNA acetyltransferase TAN1